MGGCSLVHMHSLQWLIHLVLTASSCQGGGKMWCKGVDVPWSHFHWPKRGCVKQHGWERKWVWDLLSIRQSSESSLGPCSSNCTFIQMLWNELAKNYFPKIELPISSRCGFDVLETTTWCSHFGTCLPFEECIFLTKFMSFFWIRCCAQFIWCMSIAELFINEPTSCSSCVGAGLVLHSFRPRTVVNGSAISLVVSVWCSILALYLQVWMIYLHNAASKMTHGRSGPAATCCFLLTKLLVFGSFAHLFVRLEWFISNCAYSCTAKLMKCCPIPLLPLSTWSTFLMKN